MRRTPTMLRLALVAAGALAFIGSGGAMAKPRGDARGPDATLHTVKDQIILYRLYTGPDERSHVESIHLTPRQYNAGRSWIEAGATRMTVGAMPDGLVGDYHPALRRTVLIPFQGTVIIDVGDGKTYPLKTGQMVLAEDRTGKGHISTCKATPPAKQCLIMMINLKDGEEGLQAGFAAPPPPPNFSTPHP